MAKVMDGPPTAELTANCKITIPKRVREQLNIGPGDKIRFYMDSHGGVAILPVRPLSDLKGMLGGKDKEPLTQERIDRAIEEAAVEVSGLKQK